MSSPYIFIAQVNQEDLSIELLNELGQSLDAAKTAMAELARQTDAQEPQSVNYKQYIDDVSMFCRLLTRQRWDDTVRDNIIAELDALHHRERDNHMTNSPLGFAISELTGTAGHGFEIPT